MYLVSQKMTTFSIVSKPFQIPTNNVRYTFFFILPEHFIYYFLSFTVLEVMQLNGYCDFSTFLITSATDYLYTNLLPCICAFSVKCFCVSNYFLIRSFIILIQNFLIFFTQFWISLSWIYTLYKYFPMYNLTFNVQYLLQNKLLIFQFLMLFCLGTILSSVQELFLALYSGAMLNSSSNQTQAFYMQISIVCFLSMMFLCNIK